MTAPTPTPTAREAEILRAIHAGRTIDEILDFGAWTLTDVTTTIRRFNLQVAENGRIERTGDGVDSVIALAMRSPSQLVRNQALRAQGLLRELRNHLAVAEAERSDDVARQRARQAVNEWMTWLVEARNEARLELRKLNPNAKRPREGTGSRGA
jgi:hypothetical protein